MIFLRILSYRSLSEMTQVGMLQFMFSWIWSLLTSLESRCRGCHVLTYCYRHLRGEGGGMNCSHQSQTCKLLSTDSCFCLLSLIDHLPLSRWRLRSCSPVSTVSSLVPRLSLKNLSFFTELMFVLCFSGRAILMQITKTRMWGKGILTRSWKRWVKSELLTVGIIYKINQIYYLNLRL